MVHNWKLQFHAALLLVLCSCSILQMENLRISPRRTGSAKWNWFAHWLLGSNPVLFPPHDITSRTDQSRS